jgi:hypothetical protein
VNFCFPENKSVAVLGGARSADGSGTHQPRHPFADGDSIMPVPAHLERLALTAKHHLTDEERSRGTGICPQVFALSLKELICDRSER